MVNNNLLPAYETSPRNIQLKILLLYILGASLWLWDRVNTLISDGKLINICRLVFVSTLISDTLVNRLSNFRAFVCGGDNLLEMHIAC